MHAFPLSLTNIEAARAVIDPVFLDTPQFPSDRLSAWTGADLALKVECLNPIRSFKGRGACYFTHVHKDVAPRPWVCASAGNFGQGLAYAVRSHEIPLVVFAATTANPTKVERMRALGAEVRLTGEDFDAAKQTARSYADERGSTFVEDGREPAITEGAGTIAIEVLSRPERFDALLIPLGNGALINGIGTWMKAHSPQTKILGVGASRAPAMERSFRAGRPVILDEPVVTIADGVAPRVPVPEAVATMLEVVDDVLLVEEEDIVGAMRALFRETGLVVEGAGAVTLAAARVYRERFRELRLLLLVGGGNADEKDVEQYLCGGKNGQARETEGK
jgi:threonine dehydratase